MNGRDGRLKWVSPLPPVPSGISQYSRDLLDVVDGTWSMDVVPEPGSRPTPRRTVTIARASAITSNDILIYNLGNSGFHPHAFRLGLKYPGVLVMHDVVFHHARLAGFVQRGMGRQYIRLMSDRYGERGASAAREILSGEALNLDAFPLAEDYIEAAKAVIVHSEYARGQVLSLCPSARVRVVPMGVPLPFLSDQSAARNRLRIPQTAFVVASITHVNPMKRMHIVLRALRRMIEQVPETILVIAGSVSPGSQLERQVSQLGLEKHVRIVGYLSDNDSRVLARAADLAVNLRYPSAGETSASLLRLLGSARPVIVTAHGPALEIPDGVVLKIPVDRFEHEMLAEVLIWLAGDTEARDELGFAARQFAESRHSMGAAVAGYRTVLADVYGIQLSSLPPGLIMEDEPNLQPIVNVEDTPIVLDVHEERVADALLSLRCHTHDGTIETVAKVLVDLGLNQQGRSLSVAAHEERLIDPELLAVLACPVCKTPVRLDGQELVCDTCGRRYQVEDGIPVMLVDDSAG